MKQKWILICPKCGSKEVSERGMIGRNAYSNTKVCLTCGFQSPLFPEITLEEAKKVPDKPRNFNPSYLPAFSENYKNRPKFFKMIAYGIIFAYIIMLIWFISFWL